MRRRPRSSARPELGRGDSGTRYTLSDSSGSVRVRAASAVRPMSRFASYSDPHAAVAEFTMSCQPLREYRR